MRLVMVLDGRFSQRSSDVLVGESQMTPALQEILSREGQSVTLVCRPWSRPGGYEFRAGAAVRVLHLPDWTRRGAFRAAPRVLITLRDLLRTSEDIVLLSVGPSLTQWLLLFMRRLGVRSRVPVIFLIRSFPVDSLLLGPESGAAIFRRILTLFGGSWTRMVRREKRVISVSRALSQRLKLRSDVVAPEVRWAEFATEEVQRQRRHVLYVGRLVAEKGVDIVCDAFASGSIPGEIHLRVAGAGPMQSKIQELSDQGVLNYLGSLSRNEVLEEMRLAAVVVVPSRTEAFGLVALEAAMCGASVLHSGVGGLTEACGWWPGATEVESLQPEEWAHAIVEVLQDRTASERARLVQACSVRQANGWHSLDEALQRFL